MAAQLIFSSVRRWFVRGCVAALLAGTAGAHAQQDIPLANGVFLVAKPALVDPQFRETVVLITELEAGGGPIGVIVNRPLDLRLSKLVPDIRVPKKFDRIYSGGPVALTQLFFLIRSREQPAHSMPVLADVYLSGDRSLLESIMRGDTRVAAFHAYVGYAGWAPGQLQVEIASGGWYVMQADADTVFKTDPSRIWPELMRRAATQYTGAPNDASRQPVSLAIR